MRSVSHVVSVCLLTALVAVAADKLSENSVLHEDSSVSLVSVADKTGTDNVALNKKPEIVSEDQSKDSNRREQPEAKPTSTTTSDTIGTRLEQNKEPEPEKSTKKEKDGTKGDSEGIQKPTEESRVTYNGVKVLRVVIQNKEQKKMIRQLENKGGKDFACEGKVLETLSLDQVLAHVLLIENDPLLKSDISRWSGNGTAVDILIRRDSVFDFLKDKQLIYDVVIDDLQKAIEEENPPIPEDEWSELEGRKVEPYSQWRDSGFLRPFSYWMTNDIIRISDRADYDVTHFPGSRKTKTKKKKKKKRRGHRMTWQMYHRMADIHGYIDYLTATYPDTCSQETIGYSVEGRPLKVLKVASGEPNSKAMWVDSGIHAREWITPATSTYIISQMVENGDGAHGVDWYFLPLVNPDGYEHSHTTDRLWRKNRANAYKGPCAGTDLNRNFGYRWGGQGSSQQPCRETYAGPGPFSEPETNAINKFVMRKSKDLKAYVSLHSYGQYILYPWGYDRKVPPDYSDLHRMGRSMAQAMKNSGGQIYRVGSAAATLYPASGGSDDWAKGTAKIKYTYTIELRDTGRHGFVLPAQYIQPTAKEAYAALKTLANEIKQS